VPASNTAKRRLGALFYPGFYLAYWLWGWGCVDMIMKPAAGQKIALLPVLFMIH